MKLLLVGKTGVFDTLGVACGYLDQENVTNCPYFGNLDLENSKNIVKIGEDHPGNELYVVGFKAPEIISQISQDIRSLSSIHQDEGLHVIPVSVNGEITSWLLTKLANIPLIGPLFLGWAKSRTLHRSTYLLEYGKNLRMENHLDAKNKTELVYAAKPLKKGGKK